MKKMISLIVVLVLSLAGCKTDESILVTGSTSVEAFFVETIVPQEEIDLGYSIDYEAVGSTSGIEAVESGTTDFGTSSRELTTEELETGITSDVIAYDGIAIVVNPENPVEEITQEQIYDIYTGEITNWSELGGNDQEIAVVSREDGSGTKSAFEEILGIENNLVSSAIVKDGNGNVASTIASNENAIGYISFTTLYDNEERVKGLDVDSTEPSAPNISNNSYPLYRPFNLVYDEKDLTAQDEEFLAWIDETGKILAPEAGLVAV